jgi:glutaminyl-tRNA synthetase
MDCCLPEQQFDDTNAEAEKNECIDHIQEIALCMGRWPFQVTHTGVYFQAYDIVCASTIFF